MIPCTSRFQSHFSHVLLVCPKLWDQWDIMVSILIYMHVEKFMINPITARMSELKVNRYR